jgi:hypothetical protein
MEQLKDKSPLLNKYIFTRYIECTIKEEAEPYEEREINPV